MGFISESDDTLWTAKSWGALLVEACDLDSWGQPVEAIETYLKLKKTIENFIASHSSDDMQNRILSKIIICINLRCHILQQSPPDVNSEVYEAVTLPAMRSLEPWLLHSLDEVSERSNNYRSIANFPISLSTYHQQQQICFSSCKIENVTEDDTFVNGNNANIEDIARGRIGSLLPQPVMERGKTYILLKIEKIAIKDAQELIDPYLTISVRNLSGKDITMPQSTPIATHKDSDFIHFSSMVHIQKPIEYLPYGFAIFLEFKHYKPSKKKTSLKCYSVLERDELKEETKTALELYKKPLDVRRKKLKLLTSKELYLYIETDLRVE